MFRAFNKKITGKECRRGYTLIELLTVIAIIVIVAAIAIPSVFLIRDSLAFKQKNDYAKTIFMAAQTNLSEMRADGRISQLQVTDGSGTGAKTVPINNNAGFPEEDWSPEYMYCVSGTDAFDLVLPVYCVESALRDQQILIEYNPYTGNVFSVFYSEGSQALTYDNVTRDEAARKELGLGYYCGSGLSSSIMEIVESKVTINYLNGEEGILEVQVPVPEQYYEAPTEFANLLTVNVLISGEAMGEDASIPTQTLALDMPDSYDIVSGRYVVFRYTLDRLIAGQSFGSLTANTAGTKLSNISSESGFRILPGQNIIIHAEAAFNLAGSEHFDPDVADIVTIASDTEHGVSPMFDYLIESSTTPGRYVLAVSNGRNLQNLNAIAPSIASKIETVMITDDIRWDETVTYYRNHYGVDASNTNTSDLPLCDLPYFVPIHNGYLFGTAEFVYPTATIDSFEDLWNLIWGALTNTSDGDVPTLSDELDLNAENHAQILGSDGGKAIHNIVINTAQYRSRSNIAEHYYASYITTEGSQEHIQEVSFNFTGLFGYVNTTITGLEMVNPVVQGYPFSGDSNPATGALVGAAGYNTVITDCGVYIDRNDPAFNSAYMTQGDYSSTALQQWYGVSGEGAVGGLAGYAKSHRTTTGVLEETDADFSKTLAFSNCFAAVPVSGNMRGASSSISSTDRHYGYSNGIGGFIGNSELTNFYNCYASGNVRGSGAYVAKSTLSSAFGWIADFLGMETELKFNGRTSMGVGGFVGTSHGTRYTNCFATGNAEGTNDHSYGYNLILFWREPYDYRTYGIAGFVGFMSYDETKLYGNDDVNNSAVEIAQCTVFTNCYSVGQSEVSWSTTFDSKGPDASSLENFSGGNGRIRLTFSDSTNFVGDYYQLYALLMDEEGREPSFEDYYIFRHSYYLSNYYQDINSDDNSNSNMCAKGVSYEVMIDLISRHQDSNGWVTEQIDAIKAIRTDNGNTYGEEYFNADMENTYKALYGEGFSSSNWVSASAADTNAYNLSHAGQAYPFSMLKGMPYYGNWPEAPVSSGLAYYEKYDNGKVVYFPLNSDSASDLENRIVVEDGYVVFIANNNAEDEEANTSIAVTIGGNSFNATFIGTVQAPDSSSAHSFNVFKLEDGYLNVQPTEGEFYVEVTATVGAKTYVLYFNPNVAMTHVNPPDYNEIINADGTSTIAAAKPDAPDTVLIRSARHFANLSRIRPFLTGGVSCIQQLNIDASVYTGSALDTTVSLDSFAGIYTGSGGYVTQAEIRGFRPETHSFFGTVTGTVKDLKIICSDLTGDNALTGTNAGIVAGISQGSILNVDLTLGNVTVNATENAGLLVGKNQGGTVEGCDITAENVTLSATNAGGLVGSSESIAAAEGTEGRTAAIRSCTVDITALNATAENAGGVAGSATDTTLSGVTVQIGSFTATNQAGGLVGSVMSGSILSADVQLGSANAATFGGIAANANNVTVTLSKVTAGTIQGTVAAGGFGTAQNMNIFSVTVTVDGVIGTTTAAGFAGSLRSSNTATVSDVKVTVTGSVTCSGGNAAGFAGTLGGSVLRCNVYLDDDAAISGKNAAGFAISSSAAIHNCLVTGNTSITGTEQAAGFLITAESGTVSSCVVTPVSGNKLTSYQGSSNGDLTISAPTAAGFIVTNSASVTNSVALGTVSGSSAAAGFIVTNQSFAEKCQANTAVNGAAFVLTNNGTVRNSYAWYADGSADDIAGEETGVYYGCYFAELVSGTESVSATVTVFPGEGHTDADGKTPVTMALDALSVDILNSTEGTAWDNPASYAAYPYTLYVDTTAKAYPYPMIQAHYGDWTAPPRYAFGLVYFEEAADGISILQLKDISHSASEPNIHGQELTIGDVAPDAETPIVRAGYAVFCHNMASLNTGSIAVSETALEETNVNLNGISTSDFLNLYDLYPLDTAAAEIKEIKASDGTASVSFIPCFARTVGNTAPSAYEIRTPEQFAAIDNWGTANYTQTHDLDLTVLADTDYTPVTISGYAGNGNDILTAGRLFTGVGTASSLNVTATGLDGSIFGNVTLSLDGITANVTGANFGGSDAVLASTLPSDGTIGNCHVTATVTINSTATNADIVFGALVRENSGTITGSSVDADITYSGSANKVTIGGLVGLMADGTLADSTVTGSIVKDGTVTAQTVIGGAVGKDGTGSAVYSNVHSTVAVDNLWASAEKLDSDSFAYDRGPIGTFIGYVNNGRFSQCSTSDPDESTNTAFRFLGETKLLTGTFTDPADVWYTDSLYSSGFSSILSGGSYANVLEDNAPLTKVSQYRYIAAEFTDCFFFYNEDRYTQTIGAEKYHYKLDNTQNLNNYTSAALTASFGRSTSVRYSSLIGSDGTAETMYYYLKDGTYYKLFVTRTSKEEGIIFTRTTYTFTLFGYNESDTLVNLDTKETNYPDYASINLYEAPSVTISPSQKYAIVTSDGAYALGAGGNPVAWSGTFRQHETLGQQGLWTYQNGSWTNSGTSESYTITNELQTQNCYASGSNIVLTFKLNFSGEPITTPSGVNTFHLYAISTNGTYTMGSFNRLTGIWDNQIPEATMIQSNAEMGVYQYRTLPETEALIPEKETLLNEEASGEAGGTPAEE